MTDYVCVVVVVVIEALLSTPTWSPSNITKHVIFKTIFNILKYLYYLDNGHQCKI